MSPKQALSLEQSIRRYNIWCGAISSGKTFASIVKFNWLLEFGPPGDAMILGVSRGSIQRNVLTQLYTLLGWPCPTSKTTDTKLYGRNVYFVGVNDEGAVRTIQGSTLAMAYGDEIAVWPAPCFRMLQGRLRVPGAQFVGTCNPEGPAHWFKKEFIDREKDLDFIHWDFLLDDNPGLDQAYKDNIKKEYTGMWYKRYILGEWAVAHGLIYDSFDIQDNIYEHPQNNPNYYIVGIDYGTSNATAAVLIAVTPKIWPQLRVEAEYYYDSAKKGRQKTDDELAQDIKQFVQNYPISAVYVDPSAASLKIELRNRNLPVLDAKNDVVEGIKVVSKFIAGRNLLIQKGCTTLIECLQTYSWCPKAADRGEDQPLKKREHIADALRYACYSAFPEGKLNNPDENLTIEQIKRNVYGGNDMLGFNQGAGGYF